MQYLRLSHDKIRFIYNLDAQQTQMLSKDSRYNLLIQYTALRYHQPIRLRKKMFKLWEKNQLLVIISRVKKLKIITFVGPKSLTLKMLKEITFSKTQLDYFIDQFTENLTNSVPIQPLTNYPAAHHVYAISRQASPDDYCASIMVQWS